MKLLGSNDSYLLEMVSKINLIAFPYEYYLYVEENFPYFDLQLYKSPLSGPFPTYGSAKVPEGIFVVSCPYLLISGGELK
jgi:hypothetical protein